MVGIKGLEMPNDCMECMFCNNIKSNDYGTYGDCAILGDKEQMNLLLHQKHHDCPLVEIEPLTDTEKRLFLSAIKREEEICKKIDCGKELRDLGVKELAPIVRSIERKVKKALWA